MNKKYNIFLTLLLTGSIALSAAPVKGEENLSGNGHQKSVATLSSKKNIETENAVFALNRLQEIIKSNRPFKAKDRIWLENLQKSFGRDYISLTDPDNINNKLTLDCRLTVENLNKIPDSAKKLYAALDTMLHGSLYNSYIFNHKGIQIPVNNQSIFNLLKENYQKESFSSLLKTALAHGCFNLPINKENGLVATSEVTVLENKEMSARQWVTDTVRAGELEKVIDPDSWQKALNTLAKFYTNDAEQKAFDKAIQDPNSYRLGDPNQGVAHIFYPDTLERDPKWFNNKRLESHGLALKALTEGLIDKANSAQSSNLSQKALTPTDIHTVQSIVNLAAYFIAIDYSTAPSAGNWEEVPLPGGLTWDTEAIRSALASFYRLLYSSEFDNNIHILEIRKNIAKAKHSNIACNKQELEKAILAGEKRVRSTYMAESPGLREMDSSLVFIATSDVSLDNDPTKNVEKFIQMLDSVEKNLVRDYGMIRYAPFNIKLKNGQVGCSPDSYLTLNYNIACDIDGKLNLRWKEILDKFGSQDASDPEIFMARATLASPNKEAQWFMVSDLALGYLEQVKTLVNLGKLRATKQGIKNVSAQEAYTKLTAKERDLAKYAWDKATLNINRSYARITGEQKTVKANGVTSPKWSIPEAWQFVSDTQGQTKCLPGINTPLTWAKVSLYKASEEYLKALDDNLAPYSVNN